MKFQEGFVKVLAVVSVGRAGHQVGRDARICHQVERADYGADGIRNKMTDDNGLDDEGASSEIHTRTNRPPSVDGGKRAHRCARGCGGGKLI